MSATTLDALSLSHLQQEDVRANPYPFYVQLRSQDPVHWDEELGFWVLSRFADIESLYLDERFSRAQGLLRGFDRLSVENQKTAAPVYHSFSKTVFYADPPYHTHLRGLMNNAFTPRRVEQLRPTIQRLVDELLDAAQANGGMDVVRDFAYPLPVLVIAELLGLPAQDRAKFKQWSDDLFAILGTMKKPSHLLERAAQSLEEMTEYVTALSQKRRAEPRDDLLSALLAVVDDDQPLSPPHPLPFSASDHSTGHLIRERSAAPTLTQDELVANVNILLSTGHETTTHLLGNGLLALLQNPDQRHKLRRDPSLLDSAIEETLRYDNPVQITYRSAVADAELNGRMIHKGDLVNTIIGSANRDPERFTAPDVFDLSRNEGKHLSFGLGIHYCIGAPLVKLEAEIAFETILRRFPDLALVAPETLEWQEHPIFRGLKSLPVKL